MKKTIIFILVISMLFTLCACSNNNSTETTRPLQQEGLLIGYGQREITPKESVPLASYGDQMNRFSTGYLYEQTARCVAIQDANGNTLLLITADSS